MQCLECVAYLVAGLLVAHCQTQHVIGLVSYWETPRRRTAGVYDLLSKCGVDTEMPSLGMSGEGGNEGGNPRAIPTPESAGHHDHY